MKIRRHIDRIISEDLKTKMVMLSGPRQCGKTTLAKEILDHQSGAYYNWDIDQHREALRMNRLDANARLWVFDEVHKFRKWRNWLKGIYDEFHEQHRMLVTGSARLELFSRGGDSLQGRYFFHHLHPITFSELTQRTPPKSLNNVPLIKNSMLTTADIEARDALMRFGGFPEPLLAGSEKKARR